MGVPSTGETAEGRHPARAPQHDETLRLRLDFAYDGTGFSGWARQPGLRTVEEDLTAGLSRILRYDVRLTVAGRTDAGVHARGAVAHTDVPRQAFEGLPGRSARTPEEAVVTRLAGVLPSDIVARRVRVAPEGFDARFSAVWRRYSYTLCDRPQEMDPLARHATVVLRRSLDVDAMNEASSTLLGLNDFAAFCKAREGATTIRTLLDFSWRRQGPLVTGTVRADAFCHSMVRALVGGVVPVGEGRRSPQWTADVLAARRRDSAVTVMPGHGLVLEEVGYPPEHELAARAAEARNVRTL